MISSTLLRLAAVYFLTGIGLGMYMGIAQDARLMHVHVHINLLGWVALALVALIYRALPSLEQGWVPRAHLWLHNVGLLLFMGGVAYAQLSGHHFVAPIALGSTLLSLGVLLWVAHLFKGLRQMNHPEVKA